MSVIDSVPVAVANLNKEVTIRDILEENNYSTFDLIQILVQQGLITWGQETIGDLHSDGFVQGFGLARDGYWYTTEQSAEIAEAYAKNALPFLATQYFRNR